MDREKVLDRKINPIVLKRIEFTLNQRFPGVFVRNVDCFEDIATDNIHCRIYAHVYGEELRDYKFPVDWWQSFKDRWFPTWLRKMYPVKYINIHYFAIYPEMSFPDGKLKQQVVYTKEVE